MAKPSVTSRAHGTDETADDVMSFFEDVSKASQKTAEAIDDVLTDRTLSKRRAVWGPDLDHNPNPHVPIFARQADPPTSAQIRQTIFSYATAREYLRDLLISPILEDTARSLCPAFDQDEWIKCRNSYCDSAAKAANVDFSALAGRLEMLVKSNDRSDQFVVQLLLNHNFLGAYTVAVTDPQRALVLDYATLFVLGRAQEAVRFIANWNIFTRKYALSGRLKLVFPIESNTGDIGRSTPIKIIDFMSAAASRAVNFFYRKYMNSARTLSENGHWPCAIIDLNGEARSRAIEATGDLQETVTKSDRANGVDRLASYVPNVLHRVTAFLSRFRQVDVLRDQSMADLAQNHGINIGAFDRVTHFRACNAGLSQAAFALAIEADCLWVARLLQAPGQHHVHLLAQIDPRVVAFNCENRGTDVNVDHVKSVRELHGMSGSAPDWDWKTSKSLLADLGFLAGLAGKNQKQKYAIDHKKNDEELSAVFLETVTSYSSWYGEIKPEENWKKYREVQWQGLYKKASIFGHHFL